MSTTKLMDAIRQRDPELLAQALSEGADPNVPPYSDGMLPLHMAVAQEPPNPLLVEKLARATRDINSKDHEGYTPLLRLAQKDWGNASMSALEALLARGADVNLTGPHGLTALYWFAQEDAPDCIRVLIKAGAEVDARIGRQQRTALWNATYVGKTAAVEALLAGGADATLVDSNGRSPMTNAIIHVDEETLNVMMGHGVVPGEDEWREFLGGYVYRDVHATVRGRVLSMLLDAGAPTTRLKGLTGETILHRLCRVGQTGHIEMALERAGIDVNATDEQGNTPLHAIMLRFQLRQGSRPPMTAVRALIERGADSEIRNDAGKTPLDLINSVIKERQLEMQRQGRGSRVGSETEEKIAALLQPPARRNAGGLAEPS